jgi:hypothetical protein
MGRFTTDLVRGHPPTALTVFYDGADGRQAARAGRYRRACHPARRDVLWRDLAGHPEALSLFGLPRTSLRDGLAVVDRFGRLRIGLDARIALWRELPAYRWRAWLCDLAGLAAILERPVTPRARRRPARAGWPTPTARRGAISHPF